MKQKKLIAAAAVLFVLMVLNYYQTAADLLISEEDSYLFGAYFLNRYLFGTLYRDIFFSQLILKSLPIFAFNFLFATELYQEFCIGGVYYFVRRKNRWNWYLRCCLKLGFYALLFTILYVVLPLLLFCATHNPGSLAILLQQCFPSILCLALYLFASTFVINLLSIKLGSSYGCYIVIAATVLFAAAYYFTALYLDTTYGGYSTLDAYTYTLSGVTFALYYLNPFVQLGIPWHAVSPDNARFGEITRLQAGTITNLPTWTYSICFLFLLAVVACAVGWLFIRKQDISLVDKEMS